MKKKLNPEWYNECDDCVQEDMPMPKVMKKKMPICKEEMKMKQCQHPMACDCMEMKKPQHPMDCDCMEMMHHKNSMQCDGMEMMQLAHAYVPWQHYNKAFSPQEALMKGTLFPELWGVYPIPK